jgi:hypothetical protein
LEIVDQVLHLIIRRSNSRIIACAVIIFTKNRSEDHCCCLKWRWAVLLLQASWSLNRACLITGVGTCKNYIVYCNWFVNLFNKWETRLFTSAPKSAVRNSSNLPQYPLELHYMSFFAAGHGTVCANLTIFFDWIKLVQ